MIAKRAVWFVSCAMVVLATLVMLAFSAHHPSVADFTMHSTSADEFHHDMQNHSAVLKSGYEHILCNERGCDSTCADECTVNPCCHSGSVAFPSDTSSLAVRLNEQIDNPVLVTSVRYRQSPPPFRPPIQ